MTGSLPVMNDLPQSGRIVSGNFNPYRDWMELEGDVTAPDYYQLFGLPKFESDGAKIAAAASRAATKVRSCRPGEHAKEWSSLLDEIRIAQQTLTDPAARAAYDEQLGGGSAGMPPAAAPSTNAGPEPPAGNNAPSQPAAKFDPMLPPGLGNTNTPTPAEAEQAAANSPEKPSSILPKGLSDSVTAGYMPPGAEPPASGDATSKPPENPAAFAPSTPPENPAAFAPPADDASTPQLTPLAPLAPEAPGQTADPMAPAGFAADPMSPAGLTPLGPMDPMGSNPPAANSGLTPLPANSGSDVSNAAMDAALDILSPQNLSGSQPPSSQPPMGQPVAMAHPVAHEAAPATAAPANTAPGPGPMVRGQATPSQIAAARRKQGLIALVTGVIGLLLVGALVGGLYYAMSDKQNPAADGVAAADDVAPAADTAVQPRGPAADGNAPARPADAAPAADANATDAAPSEDGNVPSADGDTTDGAPAGTDAAVTPPIVDPQPADDGGMKPPADGSVKPADDGEVKPADDGSETPPTKPADGAMTDGGATTPPVEPPPVEPPKPPAPPKPTRAELQKLAELLTGARASLGQRDFKTAGTKLGQALQLAKLPEHKAMASRLQTLSSYASRFWRAVVAALGNLESASVIDVAGTQVAVVESSPQRIVVRYNGRRMEWTPAQIPSGFALPITQFGLPENDPENDAIRAAIYLVDTDKTKWQKARPLLIKANAAGVKDAGVLLRTIDDDYASIVRDAK